jgi:hypothetical protein
MAFKLSGDASDMSRTEPIDLSRAERHIQITGALAALITAGVFVAVYHLWPPLAAGAALEDRLGFALAWCLVPLLHVVGAIGWVAGIRRRSAEDVKGAAAAPPSPRLALSVAFLQNTLEQSVIACGAWLVLAVWSEGPLLGLVAPAAILFAAGRALFVAFYRAAPVGRAFGMHLTMGPTIILYGACLWLVVRALPIFT